MSDFYMSSTGSGISGYAYVDEQTSDTYTVGLSGGGASLTGRIGGNYRNFTWNTSNALFNPTSNQDYDAVFSAGSISNINVANSVGDGQRGTFHAAHTNDTSLTIYGGYNDSLLSILKIKGCIVGLTTNLGIADLENDNYLTLPRLDTNDLPKNSNDLPNEWTLKAMGN